MKFNNISFAVLLTVITHALASPTPQTTDIVYHCGFSEITGQAQTCPAGYRCCGPISVALGGTCYPGTTGVCPL